MAKKDIGDIKITDRKGGVMWEDRGGKKAAGAELVPGPYKCGRKFCKPLSECELV